MTTLDASGNPWLEVKVTQTHEGRVSGASFLLAYSENPSLDYVAHELDQALLRRSSMVLPSRVWWVELWDGTSGAQNIS